ncbi:hypothetical protein [Rahnella sp. PCH160]|uniref:hypothetical protein n=1 Tax=Rahnella sp. PCH160 TaxID=3447928 RepID=UPI0039FC217A
MSMMACIIPPSTVDAKRQQKTSHTMSRWSKSAGKNVMCSTNVYTNKITGQQNILSTTGFKGGFRRIPREAQ